METFGDSVYSVHAHMKRAREDCGGDDEEQQESDRLDAYVANTSTTEAVFQSILRELSMNMMTEFATSSATSAEGDDGDGDVRGKKGRLQCRGVFLHQMYAAVNNKTLIDEEVAALRSKGIFKCLQSSGSHPATATDAVQTTLLMDNATYLMDISAAAASAAIPDRDSSGLSKFIDVARSYSSSVQILTSELKRSLTADDGTEVCMDDCDIFSVMKAGFLLRKSSLGGDNTVYGFSHPGLQALSAQMQTTRKKIVVSFFELTHVQSPFTLDRQPPSQSQSHLHFVLAFLRRDSSKSRVARR